MTRIVPLAVLLILAATPIVASATCIDQAAVGTVRGRIASSCDCAGAASRTAYRGCATNVIGAAVQDGSLPSTCLSAVKKCVSKSTCGRPGSVTCYAQSRRGPKCLVKRDASLCTRLADACVGTTPFCCDGPGCFATTNTVPPSTTSSTTVVPTTTSTSSSAEPTTTSTTSTTLQLVCTDPALSAPPLGQVPVTIMPGTTNCGTASLASPPSPPFSGEIDALGTKLSDLGTGCLYVGSASNFLLPPARLPDGGTLILKVAGLSGTKAILGPSAGSGARNCTLPATAQRHCLNGEPGTDGAGACTLDTDCGVQNGGTEPVAGTCARDAGCFFGPPMPLPVPDYPFFATCVVSVFDQGACGDTDLVAQTTTFSAGLAARSYVTANADSPCPRCVAGTCDGGENAGHACQPVGSFGTSIDCPPEKRLFSGTLSVVLNGATTEPNEIATTGGLFCPNQMSAGAFGQGATRIAMHGARLSPVGLLTNTVAATVAGPFCIPSTGVNILDAVGGFPAPGAVSVPVRIDVTGLLALGLPPLLP